MIDMKFLLLLLGFSNKINAFLEVAERNYTNLPKIFNVTDIDSCPDDYLYCKIDVRLKPRDALNPPEIWRRMEKLDDTDFGYYRRDLIYRAVCVEQNDLRMEYDEYTSYGLEGRIEKSYCFEKKPDLEISTYEKILLLAGILYIILLVYCTLKTNYPNAAAAGKNHSDQVNKYIKIFSVTNTWKKIIEQTENNNKLLPIQGMRTITLSMVISVHITMAYSVNFSHNPEYIEWIMSNPFTRLSVGTFGLIVQVFFVMSSWFLAVQLKNIVNKNGQITIKDIFLLLLNRYCRLTPALILAILLHSSPTLAMFITQPLQRSHLKTELIRCSNGWWLNLFYIQNWSTFNGNLCSPGTWYLAVDTQLYIMLTLLFYLSHKFKVSMKQIVTVISGVAICIQGHTVMTTNFDGLARFTPRLLPLENVFSKPEFLYSYVSTSSNLVTYVIGFVFGSIYAENKHKVIFNTHMKRIIWFAAFFGLPMILLALYNYHFSRFIETLMAVSFRPLFALGIATGILGMTTNTGGRIKDFFEWKPIVFMANFTYSTYLFHFLVVFGRLSLRSNMVYLSHVSLVFDLVCGVILSFLFGMLAFVIFEYPCEQLQKMFIPHVTARKEIPKCKES